jgi:hypothetical protein
MKRNKERKNGTREGKERLNVWLDKGTLEQVRTESRSRNAPMQRIVETSLAERYSPKSQEDQMSLILRRLNLIDLRLQVLERLAEVQADLIAVSSHMLFCALPETPDSLKDAGRQRGQCRYERYIDILAARLRENQSVLTELPAGVVLKGRNYETAG